jgi:hypothetical protein
MPIKKDAFGFQNYREGGSQRIGEAFLLLRADQFGGAIYMGGRAIESMMRALVWKADLEIQQGKKSLDTGHDLRELLSLVGNLGLLTDAEDRDELEERVQHVARLWYNNLRFASSKYTEVRWRNAGEFGRRRRFKTFKEAATGYFDACSAITKRCEVLCEKLSWKNY